MRKWIVGVLVLAFIAGCKSTPQTPAPVEDRTSTASTTAPGTGATTGSSTGSGVGGATAGTGQTGAAGAGGNPLRDPNNVLSRRSVYFDYDSFSVKDEFRGLVEAHARYLQRTPNARITIQGNTDERGSPEYNIALGQRRADSVKQAMRLLGAQDQQIETVSFGEEKPRRQGSDEASWAENRRADIVYAGE